MAIDIERNFVRYNIIGDYIFEFGCGNGVFARELLSEGYIVSAIDLFEPEKPISFIFKKSNILDVTFKNDSYDTTIAVSSLEHCGIETGECDNPNYDSIFEVSKILSDITKKRIIITAPFGNGDIIFTQKDKPDNYYEFVEKPEWGYRLLNLKLIAKLFSGFIIKKAYAYKLMGDDYFDCSMWELIDVNAPDDVDSLNDKTIICCVLDKL